MNQGSESGQRKMKSSKQTVDLPGEKHGFQISAIAPFGLVTTLSRSCKQPALQPVHDSRTKNTEAGFMGTP